MGHVLPPLPDKEASLGLLGDQEPAGMQALPFAPSDLTVQAVTTVTLQGSCYLGAPGAPKKARLSCSVPAQLWLSAPTPNPGSSTPGLLWKQLRDNLCPFKQVWESVPADSIPSGVGTGLVVLLLTWVLVRCLPRHPASPVLGSAP